MHMHMHMHMHNIAHAHAHKGSCHELARGAFGHAPSIIIIRPEPALNLARAAKRLCVTSRIALLTLCALRGSCRWAAGSTDAWVREGAVRTRSDVSACSELGGCSEPLN